MNYTSFMIRKTRVEKNWSQEGLCRNICTASYLSKIEQGKAEPSDEIVGLLFERLGIRWNTQSLTGEEIRRAYDLLFSEEYELLVQELETEEFRGYENSPWGLDVLLLRNTVGNGGEVDPELEVLMEPKQLSLQRLLQERGDEAVRLYPCGYTYYAAGFAYYCRGDYARAIDFMNRANTLACDEGSVRIMLNARMTVGSCYSNLSDFDSMNRHYAAARRLARSLGDTESMQNMDYNIAATCLEAGRYAEALTYFQTQRDSESILVLHKLAICYEKLDRRADALEVLERALALKDESAGQMMHEMCRTVYLRLTQIRYLDSQTYGDSLLGTFALCRSNAPVGYCLFHMPWMLEWYEHHRQYKQVAALLLEFPDYGKNRALNRE